MMAGEIKKIACIGSGVIGSSWVTYFIMKGYPTNLYDINEEVLELAKINISKKLKFLVKKDILKEKDVDSAMSLIKFTTDIKAALKDVQLIQECGPENYTIKQGIVESVDKYADPKTIFASSTSGLLISEIAKYSNYPERYVGAHPYNPPHLIPLVEITRGEKTSEESLQKAYDFYKLIGKEPIILRKEALGFIANRLQVALYREAVDLVYNGVCSIEAVDKASLFGPGLRFGIMGPNLIFQLGGGVHGISGLLTHIGPSVEMWWETMADWKKWPKDWIPMAQKGVDEEIQHLPEIMGRSSEELINFRDDMLIELLKLHKKL